MSLVTVVETFALPGDTPPPTRARDRVRMRVEIVAGNRGDEVAYDGNDTPITLGHEEWFDLGEGGSWSFTARRNLDDGDARVSPDDIGEPLGTRTKVTPVYPGGRDGEPRWLKVAGSGTVALSEVLDEEPGGLLPGATRAAFDAFKLGDLADADADSPTDGQALVFDDGAWVPGTIAQDLAGLTDVSVGGVTNGQVPVYADGTWVPGDVVTDEGLQTKLDLSGGTMTGTLDVDGNRITNLPSPSDAADAARKGEVDAAQSTATAAVTAVTGHVNTDPLSHEAQSVGYDGAVPGASTVAEALDVLESDKADATATTNALAAKADATATANALAAKAPIDGPSFTTSVTVPAGTLAAHAARRDDLTAVFTAAEWHDANPTLPAGQLGLDSTTGTWRMGDGVTPWHLLPWHGGDPVRSAVFTTDFDGGSGTEVGDGWNQNVTGTGTVTDTSQAQGRHGVKRLSTGTDTDGALVAVRSGLTVPAGTVTYLRWILRFPVRSAAGQAFTATWGVFDGFTAGFMFMLAQATGNNIHVLGMGSGTSGAVDTGVLVPASATPWYDCVVHRVGDEALVYINGTLVHTFDNPAHMPDAPIAPAASIVKTAGSTARTMDLDFFSFCHGVTR